MMGFNQVFLAGNIGGKIISSATKDGRPACSFTVASQTNRLTWVRVNAYDGLADHCLSKMKKGLYCIVSGELMNRQGQYDKLTEVRAHSVVFVDNTRLEGAEDVGEEERSEV